MRLLNKNALLSIWPPAECLQISLLHCPRPSDWLEKKEENHILTPYTWNIPVYPQSNVVAFMHMMKVVSWWFLEQQWSFKISVEIWAVINLNNS